MNPASTDDANALAWTIVEKIAAAPILDGPLGAVTKAREAIAARHRLAAAPACSASPDHADIMETIANAGDDWQKQGYPTALCEVRDMANVGRTLMERIAENSSDGPLKGWHPADCPTEVVCDLLNMLADASALAMSLPDIGPDPFKEPRDDDRYETSRLRLRAAYVQQQTGVPDQTALVWRYDLGTVLEMAIRLQSILADDDEPVSAPAGDRVGSIEWAREIAARFHEYSDPLDPSLREVARLTREGRYDTQDTVETVRFTAAALACPRAAVGEEKAQQLRDRVMHDDRFQAACQGYAHGGGSSGAIAAAAILALQSFPAKAEQRA